jgi:hypothetical protein
MELLTHQRLAANAYRTLGLGASAGQSTIENAARRMRIWPDPARIPPTPWDLPWLGPLPRTRKDVEQAVARLSDPAARCEERLLWYLADNPPPGPPRRPASFDAQTDEGSLPQRHDAALAALHAAWAADPGVSDVERWRGVLTAFETLSAEPQWTAWLLRADAEGDFEKRASAAEIGVAVVSLPGALASALIPKAQEALDRGDTDACAAIVSLLRTSGATDTTGTAAQSGAVRGLLDRLEDAVQIDCREMDRKLRDVLRTRDEAPAEYYSTNREASRDAAAFYGEKIRPAMKQLAALCADDPDRLMRVHSRCADVLSLLGLGWEWSGEFIEAEWVLLEALEMARGTSAEESIQKSLDRCHPLAEQQRADKTERPALVETKPSRRPAKTASSGGSSFSWMAWIAAVVAVAIVRGLMSTGSGGSGSGNRYQQYDYKRDYMDRSSNLDRQSHTFTAPRRPTTGMLLDPSPGPILLRPPPTPPRNAATRPAKPPYSVGETSREP